jgi:tetratricopeptide (TPR) repeat protein
LAIAFLLALMGPALADKNADTKKRFEDGKTAYRLGDWDTAIEEWRAGYQIKNDAVFLFNLGQAYREKGDFAKAIFFYESYLKEAKEATNREKVASLIVELKDLLEKQRTSTRKPPNNPIGPDGHTEENDSDGEQDGDDEDDGDERVIDEPGPRKGGGLKIGGLVTAGVGLAAFATGIVFGLSSQAAADEVEKAVMNGEEWTPELADRDASGRSAATLSTVSFVIGGACLVTGTVLYILGAKQASKSERHTSIVPVVSPEMTGAAVFMTF